MARRCRGTGGKDFVAWKTNELGHRENLAVVAKATAIKSNPQIQDVITQIRQSFNSTYRDPITGADERIHRCWVVSNKDLPKETRDRIRASIGNETWDSYTQNSPILTTFGKLVSKHLVTDVGDALSNLDALIAEVSPYVVDATSSHPGQPFMSIESGDRRFVLRESFEGQLQISPVTFRSKLSFPNSPEGREKLEEFEAALATGSPATIPGGFIEGFEVPEIIRRLSEELTGSPFSSVSEIRMTSLPSNQHVPVRIEVAGPDGSQQTLDNIDLKVVQAGAKEVTLSNADQLTTALVILKLNRQDRSYFLTVGRRDEPVPVRHLVRLLKFISQMAQRGRITIEHAETGKVLASVKRDDSAEKGFYAGLLETLMMLERVQERTRTTITIPNRELTSDEHEGV